MLNLNALNKEVINRCKTIANTKEINGVSTHIKISRLKIS